MNRQTVAVLDYGMGNLRSVAQALRQAALGLDVECEVVVTGSAQALREADRVVLPGQGAMPDCMAELERSGLLPALRHAAAHKPLFGVCVGMQMLLDHSEEGDTPGLGLIPGQVRRFQLEGQFQPDGSRYKVPQMGWNQVWQGPVGADASADAAPTAPATATPAAHPHPLWHGIPDGSHYYFVHSYYAEPADPAHCAGHTHYGSPFASALARGNLFGTQFHPEKSADQGLALYRNFLRWQP